MVKQQMYRMNNKPEFFVPKNFIDTAKELQDTLFTDVSEFQTNLDLARASLQLLKNEVHIAGTKEVIIHSLSALIIQSVEDGFLYTKTMNEMIARGTLTDISCIELDADIPTICVNLGAVTIKDPTFAEDPQKGRVNVPLRVPVSSIQSIWAAA